MKNIEISKDRLKSLIFNEEEGTLTINTDISAVGCVHTLVFKVELVKKETNTQVLHPGIDYNPNYDGAF